MPQGAREQVWQIRADTRILRISPLGELTVAKEGKMVLTKYRCSVCGYVYDPALGDPEGGIKPGVPFEELPADWVCPVCGATKDMFEKSD